MLNPASVLKKTEAGLVAIKERDRTLVPRARTLLIMMDGSKTAAQLAAMNTDAAQGMELLDQLIQSGFAASVDGANAQRGAPMVAPAAAPAAPSKTIAPVAAAVPPSSPVAAPPVSQPPRDLKTSIRIAARFLEGWLGPVSESFCLQLERCKTSAEFEAKVLEIKLLLASARSVKKAEEFSAAALGR